MNRRELLQALVGSLPFMAQAEIVEADPPPLFGVLKLDHDPRPEEIEAIRQAWEALWKGQPWFPIVVIPKGMELTVARETSCDWRPRETA